MAAADLSAQTLAEIAPSEILVSYGPRYWSLLADQGSASNPYVFGRGYLPALLMKLSL